MTDQTGLTEQLERCEGLMLQGQDEQAAELLAHLAEDAEEYVDKNCPTIPGSSPSSALEATASDA